jgi:uncharacterized protein YceK
MIYKFLIIVSTLAFSGCSSIKKKSGPIELSSSVAQVITDKTILYWKLGLDNIATGISKKMESIK